MLKSFCSCRAARHRSGANSIFMLLAPEGWYLAVPGVTSTGPFNQHFVRDIGLIFLFLGGAFLVGAATGICASRFGAPLDLVIRPCSLPPLGGCGRNCAPSVLSRDFPAVTLPAIIGYCLPFGRSLNRAARNSPTSCLRRFLSRDSDCAADNTCEQPFLFARAALDISNVGRDLLGALRRLYTFREISCVAAPCSSTAAAMVDEISDSFQSCC